MVLIRASLVARPRICWAITLVDAFFRFCRRLVGAFAFRGVIGALVVSLLAPFRLRLGVLVGSGDGFAGRSRF